MTLLKIMSCAHTVHQFPFRGLQPLRIKTCSKRRGAEAVPLHPSRKVEDSECENIWTTYWAQVRFTVQAQILQVFAENPAVMAFLPLLCSAHLCTFYCEISFNWVLRWKNHSKIGAAEIPPVRGPRYFAKLSVPRVVRPKVLPFELGHRVQSSFGASLQ